MTCSNESALSCPDAVLLAGQSKTSLGITGLAVQANPILVTALVDGSTATASVFVDPP